MKRGKLYRETSINEEPCEQFVLPQKHIPHVLRRICMFSTAWQRWTYGSRSNIFFDRFFWPGMAKDVDEWIKECLRWLRGKTPTNSECIKLEMQGLDVVLNKLALENINNGKQGVSFSSFCGIVYPVICRWYYFVIWNCDWFTDPAQ